MPTLVLLGRTHGGWCRFVYCPTGDNSRRAYPRGEYRCCRKGNDEFWIVRHAPSAAEGGLAESQGDKYFIRRRAYSGAGFNL